MGCPSWGFLLRDPRRLQSVRPRRRGARRGAPHRTVPFMASLCRLANPVYFQTLASSARSLFEVGLDLALLDRIDDLRRHLQATVCQQAPFSPHPRFGVE